MKARKGRKASSISYTAIRRARSSGHRSWQAPCWGTQIKRELRRFTIFGECIGLAFQIMDDLLDVEGAEAEVGKKLKKDAEKQTYIRHYGIAVSKERIDDLIEKAVASLRFLGPRADMLLQMGIFMGHRSS